MADARRFAFRIEIGALGQSLWRVSAPSGRLFSVAFRAENPVQKNRAKDYNEERDARLSPLLGLHPGGDKHRADDTRYGGYAQEQVSVCHG